MSYVIRLVELTGRLIDPQAALAWQVDQDEIHYVKQYDPWAHDGQGAVETTSSLEEAHHYDSAAQALQAYREQTPHGRPLTAYTIEIISCEANQQTDN